MKSPEYGQKIKDIIDKLDYLARLYDERVLKPSSFGKEDVDMLIEFDHKTVSEYLEQNIE